MKVLHLPVKPRGLIFDLDNTLYSNPAYAAFQEETLVARLALELGETPSNTAAKIEKLRQARMATGSGRTSLGNIFAELGFDIPTSVRWREERIEPRNWLGKNEKLDHALAALATVFRLALVTNNPRSVGEKSLLALGVSAHFRIVIGLDDTMVSKPGSRPFLKAAEALGIKSEACVSIGDRYDVDLAPAIELGMGAILVDGVEDVYRLPRLFEFAREAP